ncbi:MAG TPA: hypothetical protein VGF13_20895 [Verrucomicrobiae bacterium]
MQRETLACCALARRTGNLAAEKFINECGCYRRDEEPADAKKAIVGQ